jgi:hypothetical protein
MRIYLTDQTNHFDTLLKALMNTPVMSFKKSALVEKSSVIHISDNKHLDQLDLHFFFDYQIFPHNIITSRTQWNTEGREMQVGDTILQQAFVPPFKLFSQKIIFGVRINSIIDEPQRKGFSYVTLEGHVERGESTFTIEQSDTGVIFKIATFSEPGNWLTRLVGPVFTVPYQTYCTRKALENVKRQIENL